LSDSAARHRARQTVINLVLALGASLAIVVVMIAVVPRDDSNRIKPVDYSGVVDDAVASTGWNIFKIKPPTGWWANQAQLTTQAIDAVPTFNAGFVGSQTKYLGYTQAFNVNPTWLALQLKDVTPVGTFGIGYRNWAQYKSVVQHDPAQTKDEIWVLQVGKDAVLLSGIGSKTDWEFFATSIDQAVEGASK